MLSKFTIATSRRILIIDHAGISESWTLLISCEETSPPDTADTDIFGYSDTINQSMGENYYNLHDDEWWW